MLSEFEIVFVLIIKLDTSPVNSSPVRSIIDFIAVYYIDGPGMSSVHLYEIYNYSPGLDR